MAQLQVLKIITITEETPERKILKQFIYNVYKFQQV